MKFAAETSVSPERSKMEIEACVIKYGASQFISGWDGNRAMIQFRMRDRFIKFVLEFPTGEEPRFTGPMSEPA